MKSRVTILSGDWVEQLRTLPDASVQCVVTSPPYWGLRDYGVRPSHWPEISFQLFATLPAITVPAMDCCLGLEKAPEEFVAHLVHGFREIRRVLRTDGTCWLNLGDSYAGSRVPNEAWDERTKFRPPGAGRVASAKPKDLVGIPWMAAFALRADGWFLRSDIIWAKPNPMPESVTDRPTKAHEYIFLLAKDAKYFYDHEAIKERATYYDPRIDDPDYDPPRRDRDQIGVASRGGGPLNQRKHGSNLSGGEHGRHATGGAHLPERERRPEKERGSLRPHEGFYALWDQISKAEQCAGLRNKRSVWTVTPAQYHEAHFATFPPELIKPCILAGTSAKGACPKCGAAWKRVVANGAPDLEHQKACGGDAQGAYAGQAVKDYAGTGAQDASSVKARILQGMVEKVTVGWEPRCGCGVAETVPCVVLDPFGGTGTTGMLATGLGRAAVLIELNPKYLELMKQRCGASEQDLPL